MARLAPHPPIDASRPLGPAELDYALRAADPTALLVPPRILRRVIKQHTGVSGLGLRVPHRKTYVIDRVDLLTIVDRADLDLPASAELPNPVVLLARPSVESLAELAASELLLKYWRLLFHARIHVALDELCSDGGLNDEELRNRIQAIGTTEFEEIRTVLKQEEFLLPPKSDLTVYIEFVAVYLELHYFAPSFLRSYFPTIEEFGPVTELLKRDVDGDAILAATRLAGAPEPSTMADAPHGDRLVERVDDPQPVVRPTRVPARQRSDRRAKSLIARADQAARLGNLVRAAQFRTRAARVATPDLATAAREQSRADLGRLVKRLQAALNFSDNEADEWARSMHALLEQSSLGTWTVEARVLYDLQKVCVDHERGIYTLDLLGWVFSAGKKPLKRFLPGQRDVLISKHLRSAAARIPAARLSHRARSRLAALLQAAVHRAEASLRARFKPLVDRALDNVKLMPANPPEQVARKMLVDEILDRVVERGFLSMGDLRDALSRNNLKLPDLASVQQFLQGDQLLQADQQLATSLDGVYRAGEVYLRFPQRLSSLAFGTPLGRFLTRYVALPFGGAYVALEGLQHLAEPVVDYFSDQYRVALVSYASVISLGLLLLGLLYIQRFRELCLEGVVVARRAGRQLFVDLPEWLMTLPLVQAIVGSQPYQLFRRYLLKPVVFTLAVTALIAVFSDRDVTLRSALFIFIAASAVLNSRFGRNMDEMVTDWLVSTWHRIRIHVVAAVFRFIIEVFSRILEAIERFLYTVDEWLRFRAGERTSATAAKAVLGFLWFFVNYVIRFCVNLMIEPQINPIKHFPVVTVSHKILFPVMLAIHRSLESPLGVYWAFIVAGFIQFLIPGMFGFLVWELKENWRLYAANRPTNLGPVSIGHHGETLIQFLRPGFRSGTIPKLYAKLRRASRKAYWTRNWKSCSKQLAGLHHVSEAIRHFVDREFLEVLHESRSWADHSIRSGEIRLGLNRIAVELYCPALSEESLWLAFDEESGWLVAGVHKRGWIDNLAPQQRQALASALAGFYKMAGVDLVREQIEARLAPGSSGYAISEEALVVWSGPQAPRVSYRLSDWPTLDQNLANAAAPADRDSWVFAATPISWRRWVVTWELDQLGGAAKHWGLDDQHLLPG